MRLPSVALASLLGLPLFACTADPAPPTASDSAGAAKVADTASTAADAADAATPTAPLQNLHRRPGFLNIAHRGGGKLAPEETLEAYKNAIAVGADVIECDVHSTLDGALVCMHDSTVDRTTNGTGKINALTLEQLRNLDAGFDFSQDGGKTFPWRGKGVRVATLDEFLQSYPNGGYAIEIKQSEPPIAAQVVQAIVAHQRLDQTVLASFNDQTIAEARALEPKLTTALALGEMLALAGLSDADEATYVPPAKVIQAPTGQLETAVLIGRAHRLGMKVQFWTVNDPEEMQALVAAGADGIFTDDPAKLEQLLGGK